jgi:hypothetical protein
LTPKYEKLVLKESMGLFQKKLDAIEGKKRSENAKRFTAEICKIWTFESILGVILSM